MQTEDNQLDIKMIVMDVDGVLTDGGIILHDDGTESKKFHVRDGAWLRIWHRLGFQSAIITGRYCKAVEHRAAQLEIGHLYQSAHNKIEALEDLLEKAQLHPSQIAYIGDDMMDLPVMHRVGYPVAVADAVPEVKQAACYITGKCGGHGAVYDLVRVLLDDLGLWDEAMARYSK